MRILLVFASQPEAESFESEKASKHNHTIDILVTGIGIVPTIFELQNKLNSATYDLVINAGIAGSFSAELALGETVLVCNDIFADYIIEDKEVKAIHDTNLRAMLPIELRRGWLMPQSLPFPFTSDLKQVIAITSNRISGTEQGIGLKKELFAAQIETMEGAAVFYVCIKMNIPVIQLRSISNYIEIRNTNNWKIKEALNAMNWELLKIIEKFIR
ncbi:MAG: hypothetical protein IPO21_11870 [Bacteroidales bacterium]|nr:hypothetical protein [Bacteroidales bacterium]